MRDLIRQVVSSYQSLQLEGQGQGYVQFSAKEPDTKQPVIIKILPRVLGKDPQIAARWRALTQVIRQLNHPNITAIREVGEKAGLPYIVSRAMERARPLAEKLDQAWAVDEAASIAMQVGLALEHAFNKGLVHGSLTPSEVIIEPDGRVQVGDFGLAQLLDVAGISTKPEASPYVAPERAAGQSAAPPADVYALGAILYTLLSRRPPQIVQGQVLPPSRFNVDVPVPLDAVVIKALAANPAERYPDVKALVAALGAVTLVPAVAKAMASAQGIRCPRCGTEKQTGRFCQRCGAPLATTGAPGAGSGPARAVAGAPGAGSGPAAKRGSARTPQGGTARSKGAGPAPREQAAAPSPPQSAEDRARIQITRIDVGTVEMGKGIEVQQTTISSPLAVATGELTAMFPEPLAMPEVDSSSLTMGLGDKNMPAMPPPPPMPTVDWANMVPPLPKVPTVDEALGDQAGVTGPEGD